MIQPRKPPRFSKGADGPKRADGPRGPKLPRPSGGAAAPATPGEPKGPRGPRAARGEGDPRGAAPSRGPRPPRAPGDGPGRGGPRGRLAAATATVPDKLRPAGGWKPVGQRLQLAALERSIAHSIQWVVFEGMDEALLPRVSASIEELLANEWRMGRLQGSTAEEAYFVRCDASTMSDYDREKGQVVVMVGVALRKPAEFIPIRITQQTAT